MRNAKSIIIGISGLSLTKEEISLLKNHLPLGIILFSRNIKNNNQLKKLITHIRSILGSHCLIFIDQEGGRVQRLKQPNCPNYPAPEIFGFLAEKSKKHALRAVYLNYYLLGSNLNNVGINVNCAPCLDVKSFKTHSIIGDRSFSSNPHIVSLLGETASIALIDSGVLPVIKHIPGHGRASSDSHLSLPIINDKLSTLEKSDFVPFKALYNMPMAMTAHILYKNIDNKCPITQSKLANIFIKKDLNYKGILISDDIEMLALSGSIKSKIKSIYSAGYDIILHCSGKLKSTKLALENGNVIDDRLYKKIQSSLDRINRVNISVDLSSYRNELSNILKNKLNYIISL